MELRIAYGNSVCRRIEAVMAWATIYNESSNQCNLLLGRSGR